MGEGDEDRVRRQHEAASESQWHIAEGPLDLQEGQQRWGPVRADGPADVDLEGVQQGQVRRVEILGSRVAVARNGRCVVVINGGFDPVVASGAGDGVVEYLRPVLGERGVRGESMQSVFKLVVAPEEELGFQPRSSRLS